MRFITKTSNIISFLIGINILIYSCKKENPSESSSVPPTVYTVDITEITQLTATTGGNITSDGGATIIERGVCWSINSEPSISDNITDDGTGLGVFTSKIAGLSPKTAYFARAYATNISGTSYGVTKSLTTKDLESPVVSTTEISLITQTSAASGGNISNDNGTAVSARGVCWSTSPNPTVSLTSKSSDGTGIGMFSSSISPISYNTTYYARAYATNSIGTSYGTELSFKTLPGIPTLTTDQVTEITASAAIFGGASTYDGGASITAKGVCWNTLPSPTISLNTKTNEGPGTGAFTCYMTGLTPQTKYYARVYSTNSVGTAYGFEMSFTTQPSSIMFNSNLLYGTLTDIDGNIYKTINIGNQVWMAENLKATRYSDGMPIHLVSSKDAWSSLSLTDKSYCSYRDNTSNIATYGSLYTWSAAMNGEMSSNSVPSGRQGACPTGWHIPSLAEWDILISYVGGVTVAGAKAKEISTSHWYYPNSDATNESGFSGLPGGYRSKAGDFYNISYNGFWLTCTQQDAENVWQTGMRYSDSRITKSWNNKMYGVSIRCLKD